MFDVVPDNIVQQVLLSSFEFSVDLRSGIFRNVQALDSNLGNSGCVAVTK